MHFGRRCIKLFARQWDTMYGEHNLMFEWYHPVLCYVIAIEQKSLRQEICNEMKGGHSMCIT